MLNQIDSYPGVYVHLLERDIDDAILKANGIVQKDASSLNVQKETERLSGRGSELLKTVSKRISLHFPQI
jgi:hypothetical protein